MPVEAIDLPSFRMRRALLAFGSESASEDRARVQVQRAADPSSQQPASCRSIGAWWPDEGSILEMAIIAIIIDNNPALVVRARASGEPGILALLKERTRVLAL